MRTPLLASLTGVMSKVAEHIRSKFTGRNRNRLTQSNVNSALGISPGPSGFKFFQDRSKHGIYPMLLSRECGPIGVRAAASSRLNLRSQKGARVSNP